MPANNPWAYILAAMQQGGNVMPNMPVGPGVPMVPPSGNPLMPPPMGGVSTPPTASPHPPLNAPNAGNVGGALEEAWRMLQESGPYQAPGAGVNASAPPLGPAIAGGAMDAASGVGGFLQQGMENLAGHTPQLGIQAPPLLQALEHVIPAAAQGAMSLGANGVPSLPSLPIGPDTATAIPNPAMTTAPTGPMGAPPSPLGVPAGPGAMPMIPTQEQAVPPIPQPRAAEIAQQALRAVNDPDSAASEMAASGQEPPPPPEKEGVGGALDKMLSGMEAVQPVEGPPPMSPLNPGSGVGGSLNPQILQLLLSMQPQGKVGPSLAELLSRT